MSDYIHIVCLDAPSPADYGGAIDIYYKIVSLAQSGKKIILHYFNYKPDRNANGLAPYCEAIYSYKRKTGIRGLSFLKPYIVSSRINKKLIERLNEDEHPIIFEGIHTSGIIPFIKKGNRKMVIRMHNDEATYYARLGKVEKGILKKCYFLLESYLLKRYQKMALPAVAYACISLSDSIVLKDTYKLQNVHFIPAFIPWQRIDVLEGKGNYCLYHGNLSVAENEQAALWLIDHVFFNSTTPLIIAGKNSTPQLKKAVAVHKNITLISNPDTTELETLIQNAHIHLLTSFNDTGVKLKLVHALFKGRFCIANTAGVKGAAINDLVTIANDPEDYIESIARLMDEPFTEKNKKDRELLLTVYNNAVNAIKLNALC